MKVDVQSCFDTLPHQRLLKLVTELASTVEYSISRHTQLRETITSRFSSNTGCNKVARKFITEASNAESPESFEQVLSSKKQSSGNQTVFADAVVRQKVETFKLLSLLRQHVGGNIVKIRKKFYRQKKGIPQGSVLSSILCNLCYAAFEKEELGFLQSDDCLLMRLIDDFLLITTQKESAKRFLQTMCQGNEDYGISVKEEKTLTSFKTDIEGMPLSRQNESGEFPFCGMLINEKSLEIRKEDSRVRCESTPYHPHSSSFNRTNVQIGPSDSLTVEYSKMPGYTFRRKMTRYVPLPRGLIKVD